MLLSVRVSDRQEVNGKRLEKIPPKYKKKVEAQLDEIASAIRARREALGLTQEQLAEQLDVSPMTLQFIEQRRRDPSLPTLFYICAYLDLKIKIEI